VAEPPRPPALPGDQAQPLNPEEAAAWAEVTDNLTDLAERLRRGEAEVFFAPHLPDLDLDLDRVLNALHVPADAGVYAQELERILRRIPDGWGRWIGCDRGWWPLIIRLDGRLSSLDPLYRLEQVKEKLGGLRYYIQTNSPHAAAMEALIDEAEAESEFVCELCSSAAGVLMADAGRRGWLKTLCPSCAEGTGYKPVPSAQDG